MSEKTSSRAADHGLPQYFDMQAKIGHTKHIGGAHATHKLAELCQLQPGKILLYVGSGSGLSSLYIAEKYGCRVVGVDLLPSMVASAQNWATEKDMGDQVEFRLGDAMDLPFDADQFDAVMSESVNVFVPDKPKAMSEYVRVIKSGGYVGLTEAIWVNDPEVAARQTIVDLTGQEFLPSELWQNLMTEAGLVDLVAEDHAMGMRTEAKNQSALLNKRTYLRILGRTFKTLFADRETRAMLKYVGSNPGKYLNFMGYGIYVGRKPKVGD